MSDTWRKSHHPLVPLSSDPSTTAGKPGSYRLYPAFPLQSADNGGTVGIAAGFAELATRILEQAASGNLVRVDGGSGVLWPEFVQGLNAAFVQQGADARWLAVAAELKPAAELEALVGPYLGGDDPIFGTRFTGTLRDFFASDPATRAAPDSETLTILYGTGAALFDWPGPLLYLDVPKNEVQYRLRAGSAWPLGTAAPGQPEPKVAYKRLFFVDWPLLERHVSQIAERVTLFVDTQDALKPRSVTGEQLRATLELMGSSPFRARPWFEIGPWGGQWLKQEIPDLPREEANFAWSFELITPENGLLLDDGERQLEVAFEWLMAVAAERVLGEAAGRFGRHFPIRLNYLDTVRGGNLSVQVHPSSEYVRREFGHGLTQDETYYVVTTRASGPQPVIYLGFKDGVDLPSFEQALQSSLETGQELDVDRFVNNVPAQKHGLYLIPNGTIHSAGEGSLVLEISATTYLFTMKLYDWQRLDTDGKPRPINLRRGLDNLDPSRTPDVIEREHIARPQELCAGDGWRLQHLPTHERHFFDVHRYELEPGAELRAEMGGRFHAMNVVEGESVTVTAESGYSRQFNLAESFVIPAATGSYLLRNGGSTRALVVYAFVKPGQGAWDVTGGTMGS